MLHRSLFPRIRGIENRLLLVRLKRNKQINSFVKSFVEFLKTKEWE